MKSVFETIQMTEFTVGNEKYAVRVTVFINTSVVKLSIIIIISIIHSRKQKRAYMCIINSLDLLS